MKAFVAIGLAALAAGGATAQRPARPTQAVPQATGQAVPQAGAQAVPQAGVSSTTDGYVLGTNDEIEVTIFTGAASQSIKSRIKEDGTIGLPLLGVVEAAGKTPRRLSTQITEQLQAKGFLNKPVANVEVTQYVSNAVTTLGELGTPGVYPLDRPMTVGMMVARAGGARANSGADYVLLTRKGDPQEHRVQLEDQTGEWNRNTPLRAGDTLYVPTAPTVYIYGQVNQPGQVTLKTGMKLRQVLARAGGPTLAGSEKKVSIYRGDQEIKKAKPDTDILPGDTVFVHERLF